MQLRSSFVVSLLALAIAAPAIGADKDFVSLFDGKTLNGWIQRGGKAKYEVVDGTIKGTTVIKEPNSFLCTDRDYGDFILEVEFKVDDGLNSGIQIRSQCNDEEKTIEVDGKAKKIPAGRVHGYQVEIDPSDRAYTGGIYDEARRGWLNDLKDNKAAREAFKHNDWNLFRIECKGDSIKTWLNGVPAADLKDSMTPKGFISLQVHSTKSETPLHVSWRNIKIKEL
jgi:hypothetical protein